MSLLLTLAWRNLWRNKRRTLITSSSVFFAFLLATALISFAKGFQQQLTESLIRQETGYMQVQDAMYLEEPSMDHIFEYGEELKKAIGEIGSDIDYTVPRISGFSLAARDITTKPAMVNGIDPEMEDRLRNLSSNITEGEMFSAGDDYAVIAKGLADMLHIRTGDTLILIGQGFQAITATAMFRVGGIIDFTIPELNNRMVFLPLGEAQNYFAAGNRLTSLIIMPEHDEKICKVAERLQEMLDSEWYAVRTWGELMPDMVELMQMQDTVYRLITWVFYVIVGFGIFGTIVTMLYERMREFGIMLSLGMKRSRLAIVGLVETIFIGIIGITAGFVAGIPLVLFFRMFPVRFTGGSAEYIMNFGMEPVFPFAFDPMIFLEQAMAVFLITVLIGFYAMRKIYRTDMLDASRQ